jgi:hypothetical protein
MLQTVFVSAPVRFASSTEASLRKAFEELFGEQNKLVRDPGSSYTVHNVSFDTDALHLERVIDAGPRPDGDGNLLRSQVFLWPCSGGHGVLSEEALHEAHCMIEKDCNAFFGDPTIRVLEAHTPVRIKLNYVTFLVRVIDYVRI